MTQVTPAITTYFKAILTVCLFLLFGTKSSAQMQLAFNGTVSVSGTAGAVGAKYTYANVGIQSGVTIKAVIEIMSISGGAFLETNNNT